CTTTGDPSQVRTLSGITIVAIKIIDKEKERVMLHPRSWRRRTTRRRVVAAAVLEARVGTAPRGAVGEAASLRGLSATAASAFAPLCAAFDGVRVPRSLSERGRLLSPPEVGIGRGRE